jgi:hypothetical protein
MDIDGKREVTIITYVQHVCPIRQTHCINAWEDLERSAPEGGFLLRRCGRGEVGGVTVGPCRAVGTEIEMVQRVSILKAQCW